MQLSLRFQPIELRGASGLDAARLLGAVPRASCKDGVDLIRSDPQFSNPFSPTQVWSTSYNYEVSNAK